MRKTSDSNVTVIGVDIGKNTFHVVGLDERGRAAPEAVTGPGRGSACEHAAWLAWRSARGTGDDKRSRRRIRDLVTQMAAIGLSANEIGMRADIHHGPEQSSTRRPDTLA